jgi:hypothetical protein
MYVVYGPCHLAPGVVIALCAMNDATCLVLKYPEIWHQFRPADFSCNRN